MSDSRVLHRLVERVTRQIRFRRMEYYGFRGLFVGALVALVPLVVQEYLGAPTALALSGAAVLLGALGGALSGLVLHLPRQEAARLADRGFALQDRVTTALEWAERPDRTPLVDALVADTVARVQQLDGRRIIPRLYPREAKFIPIPLALGLALSLAPAIPLPTAGLPNFSASTEDEESKPQERVGQLESEERRRATKPEPIQRADLQERTFTPRSGAGGPTQPGDLAAIFKDTSLGSRSPDFSSFLKKGDERLRMLEQVDRLPDLKSDFTQSQYKMVFERSKALRGGLRPDQVSPEKLRELLNEMERLGRKGGGGWGGDVSEGMEMLEQGQTDKAMEAMERALSKMRSMEEQGREGKGLRGGRESDRRRGQRGGDRADGRGGPGDEGDFPEGEGLAPGRGKSGSPKGDPSQRLRANPFDVGVEGEARSGRKEGFDTNLLGRGANTPSRLQYMGVMGQYRKMMEEAIAREQVPRDFQSQVKEYFQALEER
jgi:hypothetical protein